MTTTTTGNRWKRIGPWGLKIVLALVFASAGLFKLTGQPMMIAEFDAIGLGQGFRLVTGAIELASALLLLWPRAALVGALGMLGILVGAAVAQIGPLHGDVIHVVVIAGLVLLAMWLMRPAKAAARAAG